MKPDTDTYERELSQLLTNNNDDDDKIAFQLKADHPQIHFCLCDTDRDPLTFIYKTELNILQRYRHTRNEFPWSRLSKVTALQTHRQTDTYYHATFAGGRNTNRRWS